MKLDDFFENSFKLERAYRKYYHAEMEQYHLSPNELLVMLFLAKKDHVTDTARDIADYEGVSKALVARSVDSLLEKGYISLKRDTEDKRRCHLYLTDSSDELIRVITKKQREFFKIMTAGTSDEEIAVIQRVIARFMDNVAQIED